MLNFSTGLQALLQPAHFLNKSGPSAARNLDLDVIVHDEVSAISLYKFAHIVEVDDVALVYPIEVERLQHIFVCLDGF